MLESRQTERRLDCARQGVMAYALAGRWLMHATGRTPPQNANMFRGAFLDEVTNTPPNGTTDTGRTGITVIDDSCCRPSLRAKPEASTARGKPTHLRRSSRTVRRSLKPCALTRA